MEATGNECRTNRGGAGAGLVSDAREDLIFLLYKDFQSTLFTQVLQLTNYDRQWAEDVVQETIIRAWRNSATLDREPGMLRGWLLTVARRIVIDGWRNRRARPQEVELENPEIASRADQTDRTLAAMVVTDALRGLDHKYRSVIYETYLTGHTVQQAASILGIPEGTVKSRLYTAVRKLRKALGELTL
jgi:RNA polymerase sigma-70 factor (ECF subfamily)